MADEDYYDVWLDMLARVSRPRFRALILDRAGVALDADLAQYLVTIELRGPIGVLELADLVEQNHPKVSRTLARLERLGLVERAPAAHDRRIKTASVTPEGRRVVEAINRGRRRLLEEAFAGWSEPDRVALARLTRRFANTMFALIDSLDAAPGGAAVSESSGSP
ncbi:MAG TPA: MarR family transcriptional regulator [Streptosporangiaceae bacterium]|jgi:DNA-binding MarR family transcriptional regulator